MTRSRRGHHEGSVYQRGDGQWCASVSLGHSSDGRRRRKVVLAPTKKAALEKLRSLQVVHASGRSIDPERRTLADLVNEWLDNEVKPNLRAYTYRAYRSSCTNHIVPKLGATGVHALTQAQVRTWLAELDREGVGGRARQFAHTVLTRVLGNGVRWGYANSNVAALVPTPRHERRQMRVWTPAQLEECLAAAQGTQMQVVVMLAALAGLRQGEILGLHWSDIDFDKATLMIVRQQVRTHEGLAEGPPKTRAGIRRVDLPARVIDALRQHRARCGQARPEHPVITTAAGTPVPGTTLHRWWATLARSLDGQRITFHELRHTQATMLIAGGVDARSVQERLGHSDVSVTLREYAHVTPSMQLHAVQTLDKLFGAGEPNVSHRPEGEGNEPAPYRPRKGPKPSNNKRTSKSENSP